jgi:serine/threonine protein kinase/tetratricopeptide (TPR) repeat protein
MATAPITPTWREIDPFVFAYEQARTCRGRQGIEPHLPPIQHPYYFPVLRELIRVDLERACEQGQWPSVEDYLRDFPELRQDAESIEAIAFEEYRLRQRAGEQPSPAEYQGRFGLDTGDWPASESLCEKGDSPPKTEGDRPLFRTGSEEPTLPADGPYAKVLQGLQQTDPVFALRMAEALRLFPAVGSEFLGFYLLRELGRGAVGRVFLAEQGDLANRHVAFKISVDLLGEPQTLAQLQHTHIVPIYSMHQEPPFQALCMPYFGSTTFADICAARRQLAQAPASGRWLVELLTIAAGGSSRAGAGDAGLQQLAGVGYVEAVLRLGMGLAEGLAHAHERGIVHGDLKPANVLLSDEGQPMLLDFNLAQDLKLRGRTSAVLLGGTLPYMAPEQLTAFRAGQVHADVRSDIYALGLILVELLSGKSAFPPRHGPAGEILEPMLADRTRPLPDLRRHCPALSPAEASMLRHCLEPDPGRRYPSARALQEDLAAHLARRPLQHAPEPSWRERGRKWLRRHPRLSSSYVVGAAATLVVLLLATLYSWRGRELTRVQATQELRAVLDAELPIQFLLGSPDPEPHDLQEGLSLVERSLGRFGVLQQPAWQAGTFAAALPAERQEQLRRAAGEQLLFLARGAGLLACKPAESSHRQEDLARALEANRLAEGLLGDESRAVLLQGAYLLHEAGDEAEARGAASRAAQLPARTVRDYYHAALEKMRQGNFAVAEPLLLDARRQEPQNAFVWYQLGLCSAGLARYQEAVARFDTSIALWPGFHGTYYERGRAWAERGDYAQAIADFTETLRLRDAFMPAYFDRALARTQLNDNAGALADLNRVIDAGPAQTRAFFARAEVRARIGDQEGARRDRAEGLRRQPADELSWVVRGVHRLDNPSAALGDFEEALRLNPRSLAALEDKAFVFAEKLGRTADAVAVLSRLLDLYPGRVGARASRGVLQARLGRRDAALADAEEALRRDAGPANQYQVAGIFALTSRLHPEDRDRAFELLSAALRGGYGFDLLDIDPDLAPIRSRPEFGRLVAAAKAIKLDPRNYPNKRPAK